MYPANILNARVDFSSHVNESATAEQRAEVHRQRSEARGVPYLILKPVNNRRREVQPGVRARRYLIPQLVAIARPSYATCGLIAGIAWNVSRKQLYYEAR